MTDALSILKMCRESPGDLTAYLMAADFFGASDEGDAPDFERALRWMAANQKWPYKIAYVSNPVIVSDDKIPCWVWARDDVRRVPEYARLPGGVAHAIGIKPGETRYYYAWAAALADLAKAVPI